MNQQHFRHKTTGHIATGAALAHITGEALADWEKYNGPIHNAAHPCDVRCTSARGPHCECSCNGKNHGADHDANSGQEGLFA